MILTYIPQIYQTQYGSTGKMYFSKHHNTTPPLCETNKSLISYYIWPWQYHILISILERSTFVCMCFYFPTYFPRCLIIRIGTLAGFETITCPKCVSPKKKKKLVLNVNKYGIKILNKKRKKIYEENSRNKFFIIIKNMT